MSGIDRMMENNRFQNKELEVFWKQVFVEAFRQNHTIASAALEADAAIFQLKQRLEKDWKLEPTPYIPPTTLELTQTIKNKYPELPEDRVRRIARQAVRLGYTKSPGDDDTKFIADTIEKMFR